MNSTTSPRLSSQLRKDLVEFDVSRRPSLTTDSRCEYLEALLYGMNVPGTRGLVCVHAIL